MSSIDNTPLPPELFQAEHLPSIPAVAVEVLRLCRDEDTTLDDLAEVLEHDPALAARLLRFANSALYNLGSDVSTLQRATLVLGMKTVQLMSLTFSLAPSLPRSGRGDFDYERFWRRSVMRAVAGRSIATLVGSMTEDEVFLCGLLGEIGQIVLAECMPESYAEVLEAAGTDWPTLALERELLGFDQLDVSRALLQRWEFPDILVQALVALHDTCDLPDRSPEVLVRTCKVLELAGLVTDFLTGDQRRVSLERLEAEAQRIFQMHPSVLDQLIEGLEAGLRETSEMFSLRLPDGRTTNEILAEARGEYTERSLGRSVASECPSGLDEELLARVSADATLRDDLTGALNGRALDVVLKEEVSRRQGSEAMQPLGLLCFLPDQQELADDPAALARVRATVQGALRPGDLLAHMGAGEFVVLVGSATPFGLRTIAERLRRSVLGLQNPAQGRGLRVTLTIGGLCLGRVFTRADGSALHVAARHLLDKARSRSENHCLIHGSMFQAH